MKMHLLLITILMIGAISCNDFLAENDPARITVNNYYKTEAQAQKAINAIYTPLQSGHIYKPYGLISYDEGRGDGIIIPPNFFDDNLLPYQRFTFNEESDNIEGTWRVLYQGIYNANTAIQNIEGKNYKKNLLGQAYFLRGFYYFTLARLWGAVPIVLDAKNPTEARDKSKSSADSVYAQAQKDMLASVDKVSASKSDGPDRVTKGAVLAMLSRLYLYQSKFEKAAEYAKKVMDLNAYSLDDSYKGLFVTTNNYKHTGIIWQAGFHYGGGTTYIGNRIVLDTDPLGYYTHLWNGTTGRKGRASLSASENLFKLYQESAKNGDVRFDANIRWPTFQAYQEDGTPFTVDVDKEGLPYYISKWTYKGTTDEEKYGNTSHPWPIIRYADVLLMYAEATNNANGGPNQQAYSAVNKVRNRAGLPDLQVGLGHDAFQRAVWEERRRELAFEGLRVPDLIRTGRFDAEHTVDANRVPGAGNFAEKYRVLPIPARALKFDENLVQNELWR